MTRSGGATIKSEQRAAARVVGFLYLLSLGIWLLVREIRTPVVA